MNQHCARARHTIQVLIVDDDPTNVALFSHMLDTLPGVDAVGAGYPHGLRGAQIPQAARTQPCCASRAAAISTPPARPPSLPA